jgi:hypothetical protein
MTMISRTTFLSLVASAAGATALLAAQAPQAPAKVQVPAQVRAQAENPKPPADSTQAKSIGKGKATAHTANTPTDTDSLWVEKVDIDGDGNVDEASMLWDDEDRVLYLYKDGTFTCSNGGTGSGGMLIAVYGKGNTHHKPAGSGWWAVELDKDECAAQAAGLYGCNFDANGDATKCGAAAVDDRGDALVVTASMK